LEAEAVGWGLGEESWAIEKLVVFGSPGQLTDANEPTVWDRLDAWLQQSWTHQNGLTMKIIVACVDTGGHHTTEAYEFVMPRQSRGLRAVKGSNQPGANLLATKSLQHQTRVWLWTLGTNAAKDTLFSRLKLTTPGPGFMHFPMNVTYDEEHFAQLTAESKVTKYHKGVVVGSYYKKLRARNEALDLAVMNMAALAILNPSLHINHSDTPPPRPPKVIGHPSKWGAGRKGWMKR